MLILHRCEKTILYRYASIFSHAPILYCDIINEFGKKKDLKCALKAFEITNQKLSEPDMIIIDKNCSAGAENL